MTEGVELNPGPALIVEKRQFVSDDGRVVMEYVPRVGEAPEGFNRFLGRIRLSMNTPMGPISDQVEFPIHANDLKQAYCKFNEEAKKAGKIWEKKTLEDLAKMMSRAEGKTEGGIALPSAQDTMRVVKGGGKG